MLVLGIETSGLDGTVALLRDGTCLGERELNRVGRRHAQSLASEVGDLLRSQSLSPNDVGLVAVSRGPGSFTGLRVGMVFAKTFAYATGCQFIAVDTFAAIAANTSKNVSHLFVIDDAQRDDLFVGEYVRSETHAWTNVAAIQLTSIQKFLSGLTKWDIVTGPGLSKLDATQISAQWLTEPSHCRPRATAVAQLGSDEIISGRGDAASDTDFWRAVPFYLRLSAAEEKKADLAAKAILEKT